jgi:radical SAM protein with 4Fe4S-binding SPASM domain
MDIINKQHYEQIRKPTVYEKALGYLKQIDEIFAENNRKFELGIINGCNYDREELQKISQKLFDNYKQLKKVTFGSKFPWPEHFYTGDLSGNILKTRRLCSQVKNAVSVFWNGEVSICSYDYSGKLVVGNLAEKRLSEIYNGEKAKKIRKIHFLQKFKQLPICKKCLIPRFKGQNSTFNYSKQITDEKSRGDKKRN